MKRRFWAWLILVMVAFVSVCGMAYAEEDEDDQIMNVWVVNGLPAEALLYSSKVASGPMGTVTDADIQAAGEAAWTGDVLENLTNPTIIKTVSRNANGSVSMPRVVFIGKSGLEGQLTCTLQKNGETIEQKYRLVDTHLTYNGNLENVPGLEYDEQIGMYVLRAKAGTKLTLKNFLEVPQGWKVKDDAWMIQSASSAPKSIDATDLVYTVPLHDPYGMIQFLIKYQDSNGDTYNYGLPIQVMVEDWTPAAAPVQGNSGSSMPRTGDSAQPVMWLAMMAVSLCLIAAARGKARKA